MQHYKIREICSVDELMIVYDLIVAQIVYEISVDRHRSDLRKYYDRNRHLMLMLEYDSEVIGGALGYGSSLFAIAIVPEHRGIGLGTRIMQTFEYSAMTHGLNSISLGAYPDEKGFFTKLGYMGRKVSLIKDFPRPGRVTELKLQKLHSEIGDLRLGHNVVIDGDRIPPLRG